MQYWSQLNYYANVLIIFWLLYNIHFKLHELCFDFQHYKSLASAQEAVKSMNNRYFEGEYLMAVVGISVVREHFFRVSSC